MSPFRNIQLLHRLFSREDAHHRVDGPIEHHRVVCRCRIWNTGMQKRVRSLLTDPILTILSDESESFGAEASAYPVPH